MPAKAATRSSRQPSARKAPARTPAAAKTPPLPQARPQTLGFSPVRLARMTDAFRRDIDKGTIPGVVAMAARHGQIGYFEALGLQAPATGAPMARDTLFRIFSMTKPVVSIGVMQLVEDGRLLLSDPLEKFIPEFAAQKVGVAHGGKLDLVPLQRPITIQDLLRHTSGITYEITGDGPVQKLYQQSPVRSRKIDNAEHARIIASLPLICQPGAEWNYSRSTDILGRVVEVVSGKTLGAFLAERVLTPLRMTQTGFSTAAANKGRAAEPFATDPWTGEAVRLFDITETPAMESGGGGLVSTAMDYARFCQMLLNGGTLDGERIIGRKTLAFMTSNHLDPTVAIKGTILSPGHGFGLGFCVRTHQGLASITGSVGQFYWSGIAGTFFWIDPQEDLFALLLTQGPGQREYFRNLVRNLVYAALD
jgi:CubicO group peptidase (beta-lactamase class C family)